MKIKYTIKTTNKNHTAKHSFVYTGRMIKKVEEDYGRSGLCLKIFYNCDLKTWGDNPKKDQPKKNTTFNEATVIQNIAAYHGLAPRVYDVIAVKYNGETKIAQVTDYLGKDKSPTIDGALEIYAKIKELGEEYGWENGKDDCSGMDAINGKLVDLQTFFFNKSHFEKMRALYVENARYGKIYYHRMKLWDLNNGPRDNDKRYEWMALEKVDFTGKSYVDLGSAGGAFCQYASKNGAKKVVGIDCKGKGSPDPVYAAYLAANENKCWNIDFYNKDLSTVDYLDIGEYDITSFLSMNFHIGIPEWLPKVTKELCIFEDNSKNRDALETLETMFDRVEKVGIAKDHGDKILYHCWK